MTAKLSPKMQKLVDEMAEGTKIVAEIYGDFEAYIREADGRTHNGRSINATAKALIARGILVKGEGHYWVLAGTETSAEAPAEIPADEAPEFTPLAEGNLVARIGEETGPAGRVREILHHGIRAYVFRMKGADGTTVSVTFDRYSYPEFVYTSTNQMISNALSAIMKKKGAEWTTAEFKLIPVEDPHV